MSTPTPRTDEARRIDNGDTRPLLDEMETMERELAAERTTLAGVIEIKRGVEAELAEMKRRLSSEKLMYKLANDSAIKHEWAAGELRNELAAERAKVRTLREALDEAQSCGGLTGAIFMQARAALAATEDKP
jgi:predicted RNase H-like nuclease (RuvC/YqgF family)